MSRSRVGTGTNDRREGGLIGDHGMRLEGLVYLALSQIIALQPSPLQEGLMPLQLVGIALIVFGALSVEIGAR